MTASSDDSAPQSRDLVAQVLEAAAAPGDASIADVHLALAAIAAELRTANIIAASALSPAGRDGSTTRRAMEEDAIERTGYEAPERQTPRRPRRAFVI